MLGGLGLGGAQSLVLSLYKKIDRSQVYFDIVSFENERSGIYNDITNLGSLVFECPRFDGANLITFVRWWTAFFEEHQGEYDILHGHLRGCAFIYLPLAKKYGLRTIIHSHSTSNGFGLKAFIKGMTQFPIRYQAEFLLACSKEAGEWLYGKKVWENDKFLIVPNAIDTEKFSYRPDIREKVRKEFHLEGMIVIGNIGRFTQAKNQSFLLDILYEMASEDNRIRLLLVGDGDTLKRLKKKAVRLGIAEKVVFAGSRKDSERMYQAMDVFVLPSLWEGLGIVVIEAQASGLPCLVSENVPKSVDIGADLVVSLPLQEGAKCWAYKLQKLILDGESSVRKSMADEVMAAGYDISTTARKMQQFYIKICKGNNRTDNRS